MTEKRLKHRNSDSPVFLLQHRFDEPATTFGDEPIGQPYAAGIVRWDH
jgi:hypothetical protein